MDPSQPNNFNQGQDPSQPMSMEQMLHIYPSFGKTNYAPWNYKTGSNIKDVMLGILSAGPMALGARGMGTSGRGMPSQPSFENMTPANYPTRMKTVWDAKNINQPEGTSIDDVSAAIEASKKAHEASIPFAQSPPSYSSVTGATWKNPLELGQNKFYPNPEKVSNENYYGSVPTNMDKMEQLIQPSSIHELALRNLLGIKRADSPMPRQPTQAGTTLNRDSDPTNNLIKRMIMQMGNNFRTRGNFSPMDFINKSKMPIEANTNPGPLHQNVGQPFEGPNMPQSMKFDDAFLHQQLTRAGVSKEELGKMNYAEKILRAHDMGLIE